jgi:hypothetical protein
MIQSMILTVLAIVFVTPHAQAAEAELVSVQKVWGGELDEKPHKAFTDMIRFKGEWYMGFREGIMHHGGARGAGQMRILNSVDGEKWTSSALFVLEEGDLRDAKFSITKDNELMLNTAIQVYKPNPEKHKNFAWFSKDGKNWSEPVQIGEPDIWIWSVTWHDGIAYGVGYPTTPTAKKLTNNKTTLYRSEDGRKWEILIRSFYRGNESAISFKPDGTAVCLLRAGNAIGQAKAPYTEWSWKNTLNPGGPDMIYLPDGRLVVGCRSGWGTTKLFDINPDSGKTKELLSLPSRSDCSYPGLVWHDGLLWISYYTGSDEAKEGSYDDDRFLLPTEIRLAKVKIAKLKD